MRVAAFRKRDWSGASWRRISKFGNRPGPEQRRPGRGRRRGAGAGSQGHKGKGNVEAAESNRRRGIAMMSWDHRCIEDPADRRIVRSPVRRLSAIKKGFEAGGGAWGGSSSSSSSSSTAAAETHEGRADDEVAGGADGRNDARELMA